MIRILAAFFAVAMTTIFASAGLVLGGAEPASAASSNVTASCSSLQVKPKAFTARGEVRVTVDGDVQTEGTVDGWRSFATSFTGVYTFDPTVTHEYTVEINSFDSFSGGRSFEPGSGSDAEFTGPTVPCGAVALHVAASNCVSATAENKQSLDLTISNLRRSTTYLVEVLQDDRVAKHFQFRTSPVVSKSFSGLTAGAEYMVRVTDQSDDALSTSTRVVIPGCAANIALLDVRSSCVDGDSSLEIALAGLVSGREYEIELRASVRRLDTRTFTVPSGEDGLILRFDGLASGGYVLQVSDAAAPRALTGAATVADCSTAGMEPGTSSGTAEAPLVSPSVTRAPAMTVGDSTISGLSTLGALPLSTLAFSSDGGDATFVPAAGPGSSADETVPVGGASSDVVDGAPSVPRPVSSAAGLVVAALLGAMIVGALSIPMFSAVRRLRARIR